MSISLGTRISPRLREQGMDAVTAWAVEIGLDALDLPSPDEAFATACKGRGLHIGTVDVAGLSGLISPDEVTRMAAVETVSAQIRAAAELGAKVVFMCLVPSDNTQSIATSLALFAKSFPQVAEVCEECGIKVAFEGWPGPGPTYPTLGYTPEVWRQMFALVPSKALGLCFDPSHLVRLGIDYLRVLEEFGDRVYHCHGKDTSLLSEAQYLFGNLPPALSKAPAFSGGAWRYCIPGTGEVDWSKVAYQLEQRNYNGCVSVELEDARYWGSLEAEKLGIQTALEHLKSSFRQ